MVDHTSLSGNSVFCQIPRHVLSRIPEILTISKSTIRPLLPSPHKSQRAAKRYGRLVAAKLPPKRNHMTLSKQKDFLFTCAQVNFVSELSEMLVDETVALSADDKNKLNVGTLAVSRYFNIGKMFMTDDQPNYPDHDFPYSGAKLIPAGYLLLKSRFRRSRSVSPQRKRSSVHIRRRSSSQRPLSPLESTSELTEQNEKI